MRQIHTRQELQECMAKTETVVFVFTADWCGDCQYLYPYLPAIEEACPNHVFVQLDRDEWLDLAGEWDVFGIPSLVVYRAGEEIGRFVDKNRKTMDEILVFLRKLEEK